jgi:formylglycine-generating enzyme required for sulfatase activity
MAGKYTFDRRALMADELVPRFIRVPAGEFDMGSEDGDEDERPVHPVSVDAFYLSAHEVTNDQYAEFVWATGHPPPAVRDLPRVVTALDELSFRELAGAYAWSDGTYPPDKRDHPVTLVSFGDAVAYSAWLSTHVAWPFGCRRRPSGNAPLAVGSRDGGIRGVTTSIHRAPTSSPTQV